MRSRHFGIGTIVMLYVDNVMAMSILCRFFFYNYLIMNHLIDYVNYFLPL